MKVIEASLVCALAISAGCASPQSLQPTRVALVDKTVEGEPGDVATTFYRIQVTTGAKIDTIPIVRTMTVPGVSADGIVHLISYDEGGLLRSAHRYDPNTRHLTDIELPPDLKLSAKVAISPDARHIAYITYNETSNYGLVQSWPDGKAVAQTPAEPWFEAEVDFNAARWLDANRAEFVYRSGRAVAAGSTRSPDLWIHAIVTLDPRALKVD